ncbi:hypothetical protein GF312_09780 [Candidatus Poribacteria bacterium]|nr:hypothetical protein [Candidatus Poribacteria bacterium]
MDRRKILFAFFMLICCLNYSLAEDFVTDGLVAYWTFDQPTVNDNNVKDVWANISGSAKDVDVVEGKINEGLEFNGKSSMITIDANEKLDITDAITLEAWIKISQWQEDPNRNIIIARYDQGQNKRYVQFSINPSYGLGVYLGHTNGTAYAETQVGTRSEEWVDQWVHVAVTWDHADDGLPRLYINAEETPNYSPQDALKEPLLLFDIPWIIGAMPPQDRYFAGVMDELKIYNRRLTEAEILKNFEAQTNFAVDAVGKLAALWSGVKSIK